MANPTVALETNHGTIVLELLAQEATKTVENFLSYANAGFYDGTLFHRVIPNFMIQGGGFDGQQRQKPARPPIPNEADNGLRNDRGTIAMARTNDPHSATAQFFINLKNNDFLNHQPGSPSTYGYAVFGKVTEGMDVIDKIAKVKTGVRRPHSDVPVEDVVITSVTRVEAAK